MIAHPFGISFFALKWFDQSWSMLYWEVAKQHLRWGHMSTVALMSRSPMHGIVRAHHAMCWAKVSYESNSIIRAIGKRDAKKLDVPSPQGMGMSGTMGMGCSIGVGNMGAKTTSVDGGTKGEGWGTSPTTIRLTALLPTKI